MFFWGHWRWKPFSNKMAFEWKMFRVVFRREFWTNKRSPNTFTLDKIKGIKWVQIVTVRINNHVKTIFTFFKHHSNAHWIIIMSAQAEDGKFFSQVKRRISYVIMITNGTIDCLCVCVCPVEQFSYFILCNLSWMKKISWQTFRKH